MAHSDATTPPATDFIQAISREDLPLVEAMYRREGDRYKGNTVNFLTWRYFENPAGDAALYGVNLNGDIEGFLANTWVPYRIAGEEKKVLILENGITRPTIRGKGYYGKILTRVEQDHFEGRGAADILTGIPNDIAGPIYIAKFAYQWAPQLEVHFTPAALPLGPQPERLESVSQVDVEDTYQPDNGPVKSKAHFEWRYRFYPSGDIHVLKLKHRDSHLGYAILRSFRKKGVPIFLLMDLMLHKRADVVPAFKQLRRYAGRHLRAGILFASTEQTDALKGRVPVFKTAKKIDFMVKGKTEEETQRLKSLRYNLTFGDMDFF